MANFGVYTQLSDFGPRPGRGRLTNTTPSTAARGQSSINNTQEASHTTLPQCHGARHPAPALAARVNPEVAYWESSILGPTRGLNVRKSISSC